jgi:hypothetical protein
MALPRIDQPTYELTLPSTKERIRYRPFLVKEEKILLMAQEGDDLGEQIESVKQIINNCIISKNVKTETLSTFDIEFIFINIRSKSVGNFVELQYKHECSAENNEECQIPFRVNLDDVYVENNEIHTNKIELTDAVGVFMKYPDFKLLYKITAMEKFEEMLEVISRCIDIIYMGDETYSPSDYTNKEMLEFLENLSQEQFQNISNFFETMPQTAVDVEIKCKKCGYENKMVLKGISDFFV